MTKTDNRFAIFLDFGDLHHCNTKKLLLYLHGITECVHLRGDRV